MDWLLTGAIILAIFGLTAILSLFIPKDRDPEINSDNGDGPVIPAPAPDGSVMGVGGNNADAEDLDMGEVETDDLIGPQ
ncbi:MAG: hypothetical protein R3C46_03865 [Hyphomonadaceae bacterium]